MVSALEDRHALQSQFHACRASGGREIGCLGRAGGCPPEGGQRVEAEIFHFAEVLDWFV